MRNTRGNNFGYRELGSLVLILAFIAGCEETEKPTIAGSLHPVSGRVMVGGRPAAGVHVTLFPLNRFYEAGAPRPEGTSDKDGRFQLRTGGEGTGAPSGQYVATLVWPAGTGGADRLGGVFAEPEGSGLITLIEDSTTELLPYDVATKASRNAPTR